MTCYCPVLPPC